MPSGGVGAGDDVAASPWPRWMYHQGQLVLFYMSPVSSDGGIFTEEVTMAVRDWIKLKNRPSDVSSHDVNRMTGLSMKAVTGLDKAQVLLTAVDVRGPDHSSPVGGDVQSAPRWHQRYWSTDPASPPEINCREETTIGYRDATGSGRPSPGFLELSSCRDGSAWDRATRPVSEWFGVHPLSGWLDYVA